METYGVNVDLNEIPAHTVKVMIIIPPIIYFVRIFTDPFYHVSNYNVILIRRLAEKNLYDNLQKKILHSTSFRSE